MSNATALKDCPRRRMHVDGVECERCGETPPEKKDKATLVRDEYRAQGKLEGLVLAWSLVRKLREHYAMGFCKLVEAQLAGTDARIARDSVRIAELMLVREVKRLYPKGGVASLVAAGYVDEDAGRKAGAK